jgi:2-polyprenyl-3-methyl-5-hydroxy-6-metoxy-1,4-benzoquinol methylase
MEYIEFISKGRKIARTQQRQGTEYFDVHSYRFYQTFCQAINIVNNSSYTDILSLGGGSAYIEIMLRKHLGVNVTVVDFPKAIKNHRKIYDRYGIDYIGADISEYDFDGNKDWQFVMCNEIIEHIPQPPKLILKNLKMLQLTRGEF